MSHEVVFAEMKVAEMCAPNSTDTAADAVAAAVGKVNLEMISWYMPQVVLSDLEKMELYETIKERHPYP